MSAQEIEEKYYGINWNSGSRRDELFDCIMDRLKETEGQYGLLDWLKEAKIDFDPEVVAISLGDHMRKVVLPEIKKLSEEKREIISQELDNINDSYNAINMIIHKYDNQRGRFGSNAY